MKHESLLRGRAVFKRRLILLCAIVTLSALAGCSSLTFALANAPSVFGDYEVRRNVRYATSDPLLLDVYSPPKTVAARPVVVFFHGGGWDSGSKNDYRFIAEALISRGYIVIVPEYRLYPQTRFPGFVEDAAQALAWTHANVAALGGDATRIFVMGHSAGAHIASLLVFDERYLQAVDGRAEWIRGFVGLAGPYDFLPLRETRLENIFAPATQYAASQPINFVDGTEPPALLLHGLADNRVRPGNSQSLATHIRDRGGRVEETYYEGVTHGGILATMTVYLRNRRPVLDQIDRFIQAESKVAAAASESTATGAP